MNIIILISSPAGGKGTISRYIEEKYHYKHISTGNLLRNEIKNNTDIGKKIKGSMKKGKLVDDNIIKEILEKELSNINSNIVLDGIPRTINQAKILDELDKKYNNFKITKVIYIEIDKDVAQSRAVSRLVCPNCNRTYSKDDILCNKCNIKLVSRNDDSEEIFLDRYDRFIKETRPLLEYYKDKIVTIYNNNDVEDAYLEVDKILKGDE